jgi:hypothetical protein
VLPEQVRQQDEALASVHQRSIGIITASVNGIFAVRTRLEERLDYRPMELREILKRIEKRLAAVGMSATAASKAAGKPDAIRNLQRAVEKDDRQGVSTATLNALAPVLKTSVIWLFAGAGPETTDTEGSADIEIAPGRSDFVQAAIQGVVQAGHFRQFEDFTDEEPVFESVERDREFPHARHAIFIAEGDSMNDLKPVPIIPGARLVTIDYDDLKGQIPWRDNMVIIVEQIRDGGHLREWSVKQVELYENRIEFCPRSTNPKHKPIVVPRDYRPEDGKEVRVLAIVRKIYNDVPL